MSEDMARALKADRPLTVTFGDKECTVHPLSIKELTEAEQICLQQYREKYLKVWRDNSPSTEVLMEKIEAAAKWDVSDLPPKQAFDPGTVKVTEELKRFVAEKLSLDVTKLMEARTKQLTAALLDQGILKVEEYKSLSGRSIYPIKIPYVSWWVTGCYDGMVSAVWLCFKRYGITKDQVIEKMAEDIALLIDVSREIERASTPDLGNG